MAKIGALTRFLGECGEVSTICTEKDNVRVSLSGLLCVVKVDLPTRVVVVKQCH